MQLYTGVTYRVKKPRFERSGVSFEGLDARALSVCYEAPEVIDSPMDPFKIWWMALSVVLFLACGTMDMTEFIQYHELYSSVCRPLLSAIGA
jgi:hypothetical protein